MNPSPANTLAPSVNALVLDRLVEWAQHVEERLAAQLTFLEVAQEHIGVELRTYYSGAVDPRFVEDMLDAALQRHLTGQPRVFDEAEHAPWRWEGRVVQEIPEARREYMVQLVESLGTRLLQQYHDYLLRHWRVTPENVSDTADYRLRVDAWLEGHYRALEAALQPAGLADVTVDGLRSLIEEHQDQWHQQPALLALASRDERAALDRLVRAQLPDWFKWLDTDQQTRLQQALLQWREAQQRVQELLSGVSSAQAHARERANEYLREHTDSSLSADLISVELISKADPQASVTRVILSELVAGGVQDLSQLYTIVSTTSAVPLSAPPSAADVQNLLFTLDSNATYLTALRACQQDPEVRLALFDAADLRLKYSALRALYAGHLQEAQYERLRVTLSRGTGSLQVSAVQVRDGAVCSELMLFCGQDDHGAVDTLMLYAPGKPDAQEWIALPSLRAVNQELGAWFKTAAGREYLLAQLPLDQREGISELMLKIVEKPSEWSLDEDRRALPGDYAACLDLAVRARAQVQEDEVEGSVSPRWYAALSIEEQRVIGSLRRRARLAEQAFELRLEGYESFQQYARKTVARAIEPYLASRGVNEAVDPESIIIDYSPALADNRVESLNLVDLVCYGYDDNAGIDHPDKGVRSSVGQDLSALRSADLARYARRAYVGEQYIAAMRSRYLDPASDSYRLNQQRFARAVIAGMDRDLRVALGSGQINRQVYEALVEVVSRLAETVTLEQVQSTSEAVLDEAGLVRLSIADAPVLGVYVLRFVEAGVAQDWLYTSDASDGILLRPYAELDRAAAGTLLDYLLMRCRLAHRERVRRHLLALLAGTGHRDALRRLNQVSRLAGEYDHFMEHALADVDDATQSRAEVIRGQVFKGLLFAAPLTLIYPPFAALIGAWFVLAPLREAVIAHSKGDTARALQEWLAVSWGTLGLVAYLPGVSLKAVRSLLGDGRRLLVGRRTAVTDSIRQPALKFESQWAVRQAPSALHEVAEEGIWAGTYRSTATAEGAGAEHFIRYRGRYFKVEHDTANDTLRVIKANNPGSYHRPAVVRSADGRWVPNSIGLRGGNPALDAGRITSPRQITVGAGGPDNQRGALQGESVVASFSVNAADNYLFTLNVQTCVAVSLFNPVTKAGAVIHFDHNIKPLIEQAVRAVLGRIRSGAARDVRAVMAGGDWLGGQDIGGPVRAVLRQNGIRPVWDHWSYSSCFGNTYGMTLDLRTGVTRVYTMTGDLVDRVLTPMLRSAQQGASGQLALRAQRFMHRVRSEPLYQGSDGVVRNSAGRPVGAGGYQGHAIDMIVLGGS